MPIVKMSKTLSGNKLSFDFDLSQENNKIIFPHIYLLDIAEVNYSHLLYKL